MADKKRIIEGYQPEEKKGYQPTSARPGGGYKPETTERKPTPNPPPKKP